MDELYYKLAVWLNDQGSLLFVLYSIRLMYIALYEKKNEKLCSLIIYMSVIDSFIASFISLL